MPNLWGVSPVGRDGGDRSYVAQAVGRGGAESGRVEEGGR